ncbi:MULTISPECIES: helix-turn-helix transcriptional regulator [unclassified Streptomyces]|uniref:helix-turn-helix domain-containing protein n=1 Tax=unclassified Streptomyces TaxID=2593676 RepID=UPI00081F1493|nr:MULTISPECIES: helix-turn-helix transcriptional regulator [unclassified Streptomyces]MYZ40048.1 helix-turn-helix domain-containing protein [Streptomyces sp. SID4917]SCG06344.1 Helix-turn-helix domain-containing protein [Streptomyces sp. MnatMP-M17]
MPLPDDNHTGARIREQRKLARLTQRELADRLPYSYSLLNQVECGARPATADFVAAVAQALRVDVTLLTGQPHVTDLQRDRLAALVRPIREALDLYDLGANPELTVRPAALLVAAADQVCQDVRATHLRKAARDLPGIIAELTHVGWSDPSTEVWRALASAYRTAHDVAVKLGYFDLSTVALDRMDWAAARASDPCLAAIRQYKRALGYHKVGAPIVGQRLIASGHSLLALESSREALAVAGQLHLGASAVAARAGDEDAVAAHIKAADELAKRVGGEARDVHWLSFGRTNVRLHEMGASVEMRQYDDALVQARKMKLPPNTLTSRRARFLVDWAFVEMETGHSEAALRHIVEARQAAPEQTRYHPEARETISGLVRTARTTPDTLGHMAAWIGL